MKKLNSLVRDKRVLIVPNMTQGKDSSLEHNHNLLTWAVYKLIKFAETNPMISARSVTCNVNHSYDVVVAMYVGDKIDQKSNILHKLRSEGKTIFEFHWCSLNGMFILERVSHQGKSEKLMYANVSNPNVFEEKKNVLGFSVDFR